VLVVWSIAAVKREPDKLNYVLAEAEKGLSLGKLVASA